MWSWIQKEDGDNEFHCRRAKKGRAEERHDSLISYFFFTALGHSERVFPKFGRQASRIGEKERSKNIIHWPLSQGCRKQTYLECKENGERSEWSSEPVGWGSDRYGQGKAALTYYGSESSTQRGGSLPCGRQQLGLVKQAKKGGGWGRSCHARPPPSKNTNLHAQGRHPPKVTSIVVECFAAYLRFLHFNWNMNKVDSALFEL